MRRGIRTLTAVVAALAALVSGCNRQPVEYVFTDLESARTYLLGRLQEKYGIEFEMLQEHLLDDGYKFAGGIVPVGDPERNALANVTRTGVLEDSWAVWQFADQLGEQPARVCGEYGADLLSCTSEPRMSTTRQSWDPATTPLDQFVAEAKPVNSITAEFVSTSQDEVAPLLLAMIDRLSESPIPYTLEITQNGRGVYHHRASDPRPTLEEIKETFP